MTVEERIFMITILEQMNENKEFVEELGLENRSKFREESDSKKETKEEK